MFLLRILTPSNALCPCRWPFIPNLKNAPTFPATCRLLDHEEIKRWSSKDDESQVVYVMSSDAVEKVSLSVVYDPKCIIADLYRHSRNTETVHESINFSAYEEHAEHGDSLLLQQSSQPMVNLSALVMWHA
ncbi:hypothetical protein AN958_10311 [Leucoagaricus sp. SymC.cos]|nr:hypothetical protein AN958_10311 [Leucoagaricus sp. SymC.cos]